MGLEDFGQKKLQRNDPETRVLVVTGDKDPINNNGKQAERMHNSFVDIGLNSEIEVYPDMRHEPLNEIGREEVFKRMESFFFKTILRSSDVSL